MGLISNKILGISVAGKKRTFRKILGFQWPLIVGRKRRREQTGSVVGGEGAERRLSKNPISLPGVHICITFMLVMSIFLFFFFGTSNDVKFKLNRNLIY